MPPRQVGRARRFTRPRHSLKRLAVAASLAALSLAASAPHAGASVTIGQVDPAPGSVSCGTYNDWIQTGVSSGKSYVVPGTGTITSWSHNAIAGMGQDFTMKIFRKVADPATYMVVAHDGPRPLDESKLNTFPASVQVQPGDILGANSGSIGASLTGCQFGAPSPGNSYLLRSNSDLADGDFEAFTGFANNRINISAVFVPANAFSLGATTRNKRKGTATLTVDVPNPGKLTGSGKGVKVAGATGAATSKKVRAPGKVKLKIGAEGKKKRKLNETGKITVKPKITYTPTGGNPSSQSIKVKLKKKL